MYQLVTAKVKATGSNGYWTDEDVSLKTIGQIFNDYRKAILYLTNDIILGTLYLDIEDMKTLGFIDVNVTLSVWFTNIGNFALPTTTTPPDLSPKLVKFGDARKANYTIREIPANYHPDTETLESLKVDLLLTKPNIDYMAMARKCLISVNGLIHLSEGSVNGLVVRGGAKSSRIANKTQVGIISFNHVADFTIIPITRSMISQPNETITMKEKVYLDIGVDLAGKTPLLVLGGYLHVLDDVYKVVGKSSIVLNMYITPYVKRYFDARNLMDLGSLGLTRNVNNDSQISVSEIMSDETITRYLELEQSFIVLVDDPDMFVERTQIECANLPGKYYTADEPVFPMQFELGRLGNYWKQYDDRKWVLSVDDNQYKHYMYETTEWQNGISIDDKMIPSNRWEYSVAWLLKFGIA